MTEPRSAVQDRCLRDTGGHHVEICGSVVQDRCLGDAGGHHVDGPQSWDRLTLPRRSWSQRKGRGQALDWGYYWGETGAGESQQSLGQGTTGEIGGAGQGLGQDLGHVAPWSGVRRREQPQVPRAAISSGAQGADWPGQQSVGQWRFGQPCPTQSPACVRHIILALLFKRKSLLTFV